MSFNSNRGSGGRAAFIGAVVCLAIAGCQTPQAVVRAADPTIKHATAPTPAGDVSWGSSNSLSHGESSSRRAAVAAATANASANGAPSHSDSPIIKTSASIKRLAPAVRLASARRDQLPPAADEPFTGERQLEIGRLVDEVLARNRSLEAMRASWLAAAQRYPQARALDDPVFTGLVAPASLNPSNNGTPGYTVGGAQKLPWFGKRQLRGQAALEESRAARWDFADAQLAVIEAAGLAYYDYYLAQQELALNAENRAKLQEFHDIAVRQYEANLAPQQDMLQAKVELAELARRQIELERFERVAIARINTLMHRMPDAYLPPAPARLDARKLALSAAVLRATAVSRRPDLAALGAQIRAEQAQLQLANKEFMPDFEVYGRYDAFWSQASQRGQVGMNMNVPIYRDKRYAAVREAQWRLSQRRAEYEQRIDDVHREVQTAYERFDEAQQAVGLYVDQILPAASKNVESSRAAYEAGRGDFLRLVAAQRQFIVLQERYQESIADYHVRRIELERVVAGPLSPAQSQAIPSGR